MASDEWLLPLLLRQRYVDKHFKRPDEAERQLYLAVARGTVRARLNGIVLGPIWLKQQLPTDNDAASFPADIELSVHDVRRIWG
jgi:hypothetical protein